MLPCLDAHSLAWLSSHPRWQHSTHRGSRHHEWQQEDTDSEIYVPAGLGWAVEPIFVWSTCLNIAVKIVLHVISIDHQ